MSPTSLQKIRVPIGFAYAALYVLTAAPEIDSLWIGLPVIITGLAIRIWAAGHIEKGKILTSEGPYRWTRNPLYFGSFIIGCGFILIASNLWLIVIFCSLFLCIYLPVMRQEERELKSSFGEAFRNYRKQVPFFLPSIRLWDRVRMERNSMHSHNFRWCLVISNREYQAVIGSLIILFLTLVKMLWV